MPLVKFKNYIFKSYFVVESETPTTFYNIVDGNELEKKFNSDVDEELIRKAEAVAEKDLLNGLNMILKNNETLEDVLRMEEAEEFS